MTAAILVSVVLPSFALDRATEQVPAQSTSINQELSLNKSELVEIEQTNQKIHDYISSLSSVQSLMRNGMTLDVSLNVPLIQQAETYYCGPASALMVAKYLKIVSSTYTQGDMANKIGTTTDGSSSNQIVTALNSLLRSAGKSTSYQRCSISTTNFNDSIIYSLNNNYPIIFSVKSMPKYYSSSGHFIAMKGFVAPLVLGTDSYRVSTVTINDCHYNDEYFGTYTYSIEDMMEACTSNLGYYIRLA